MRFTHAWITRALTKQKAVFKRKSSKPIIAGIALTVVGISTAVAFALAVDPGANSRIDYAMNFDGSTTYASTSNQLIPTNSDYTIEAYVKEAVGTSNDNIFLAQGSTGNSTGGIGLGFAGPAGQRCLVFRGPMGEINCNLFNDLEIPQVTIPQGDWIHVGLSYKNSTQTFTLYLNGNLYTSRYYPASNYPIQQGGFVIGRNTGSLPQYGYSYFTGQIDEVKIFNTTRNATEDALDTYTYLSPTTPGLVAQYDFNEGGTGGGFIYDRTSNNNDLTIGGTATFSDIAQYSVPDRSLNRIRFSRSYLTTYGGWFPPAGVISVSGNLYAGGGGGGGGAAYETINGGGGGGGGAGNWTTYSGATVSAATALPVRIGLGGPGGLGGIAYPSDTTSSPGINGFPGQSSSFNGNSTNGGGGGWGGGYTSGTTTVTAGKGGKGGNNGGTNTGSTITTSNDGGGGAGNASGNIAADTRTGNAGSSITAIGITGNVVVGGSGGYGAATSASATYGAHATAGQASGGGGGGGFKGAAYGTAYNGGFGSSGTLVLTYTPPTGAQAFDYLYTFNGTNQYAESMASTTSFDLTGDLTLEAWVNPTDACASAICTIAGRDNNYLLATSNGTYRWRITTNTGTSAWYDTGIALAVGQWQHVALVRSGSSVLLYLNGKLMSTQANGDVDAQGIVISMTGTSAVGFGWFQVAARGVDHQDLFNGGIDEVRIWKVVRTAAEIGDATTGDFNRTLNTAELASANLVAYWDMNDTLITAQSFMNRKTGSTSLTDLSVIGSPTAVMNGNQSSTWQNRYLNLDSANSQTYYAPDSPAFEVTGSNFTISAWWKVPSCSGQYLVVKSATYMIGLDGNCKINFSLDPGNQGDAATWRWMNTGYVMSTATWHYVSLVKVGTTAYLYVDGSLASTIADGDTVGGYGAGASVTALIPANLGDRNTYFGIGSTGTDANRATIYSQSIDDVRIWNTDRRANQALDMAGFVPFNQAGLAVQYTFDTLGSNPDLVPNRAYGADADSHLISFGTSMSTASATASAPPGQPVRKQVLIQRSVITSSTKSGYILVGSSSIEYWIAGGGGGGGTGGNSGYSGGGGGAGALSAGVATGLANGINSDLVTVQKVGAGGTFAVNNGDSVSTVATNGGTTSFTATGLSASAVGGGAGGSGTATPAGAPQGANGGSGGGSGSTGGAGGTATAGSAGGAGSSNAAGGGGGFVSAGTDASSGGAGGAGGKGYLVPAANPVWAVGGGTGHGSVSAVNTNAAKGATASAAAGVFGSGGGGNGFASAGVGTVRGGAGGAGFIQIDGFGTQPFVEQGSTSVMSGATFKVPLKVSLRDINGNVMTGLTDTVTVSTSTAGCSINSGSGTYTAAAGQITMYGLAVTATVNKTCVLNIYDSFSGGTATYSVSVMTMPASITVSSLATTGACSFSSGWFTCPNNTVATLNVTDLNNQLNARDVALATVTTSSSSGGITVNTGLTIGGSVGELSMSASGYTSNLAQAGTGNITLGSGIALTGPGKSLIVKATGYIYTNTAATSGSRTTFSTNGGDIYFWSSTVGSYDSPIKLASYNNFDTNGGNFTATGGLDPTTGYAYGGQFSATRGLHMMANATISTGAGNVVLRGRLYGKNDANGSTPYDQGGLTIESGAVISTTSGSVSVNGYTGGFQYDAGSSRYGIKMGAATISTDSGDIRLDGISGQDASNTTSLYYIAGATITSNSGSITATGTMTSSFNKGLGTWATPQSTLNSTTGNVTITATNAVGYSATSLDFLKLTGGGTHSILLPNPSLAATTSTSLQFLGTGDLVIGHNVANSAWYSSVTVPANADFGTGYRTITIGDSIADSSSKGLSIAATLTASDRVSLNGQSINGAGAVVAPNLSMSQTGSATQAAILTGSSNVSTLAIKRLTAPSNCTISFVGINDANGWAPGTVNGIVGQFGLPTKLGMFQQPAVTSTTPRNAPLATQPIVQVQDVWGCAPTGDSALPGYTITATPTGSTMTGLPSQVSDAAGKVTYTNATPQQATATTIAFTSSPTLTSVTSSSFTPAASSTVVSSAVVSAGSTAATSGVYFPVQPKVTYYDAYGNIAVSASSFLTTAALTSYPVGASTASLITGFSMSNTPTPSGTPAVGTGVSTGSNFKITGPTGDYTITFTSFGGVTSTLTVAVTGWMLDYGATTLNYKVGTYPANFQGNGTGAVTYSTSTGTYCSVNSTTGAMTPLLAGTCTITASQAADGTYPAGSVSATVTIVAATQSTVNIRAASSTLVYGSSVALTSDGGDGTGAYTIVVKTGNCAMSGNSILVGSAHSGDTCDVWAYRAATTNKWLQTYSTPITITVTQAPQSTLNAAPSGKQAGYGNAYDLATATSGWSWGGNGTGAIVFSSNTAGCSISGTVLTSTAAIGTNCVINVQRAASTDYLISNSVTMNVLMVKGSQTVSYVTIASAVRVNGQVTLNATSTSGLTVSYALGTGSSAYCSLSGATVTFTAPGTCVINASQAGDANYNAATVAPITYTVSKALQNITFGPLTDDVVRTTTKTVSGTIDSGLAISYSVGSNTTNSACTVTSIGVVSLNAVGTCEIVASQAGTSLYEAATDVASTFAIARGTQSPLVITSTSTTTFAHNITLAATGGNGSNSYVWSATGDCSITGGNTLIPGAVGANCVVSVDRAGDANWFDATTATQTITIDKAAQSTLTITNPNTVVYGNQLALTYGGGSGTGAVTWSATSPCSVTGTNLTVGNAGVSCVITLTKDADDSYLAATATMTISVTRANQATLTIDSVDHVAYRGIIALSASGGSGNGAISWATTGTCTVGAGDLLNVGNAGSLCTVTATRAASTNYNAVSSATMTITIDKADQTIGAINAPGVPRALGSIPVAATSDSGLTVAFTVDSGSASVCSITGTVLSFTTSGTCVVNANQSGNTNFNAAPQVQRTFNVAHATQTINLVNPGQKRYQDANFAMMGSASSSLALSYSLGSSTSLDSSNNAVCAVSSTGTVQIFEVGTCQILADQTGDVVYDPAPQASVTFTIAKAFQSALSLSSADTYVYGTSLQLTATGGSGTGALTITSDASQDCQLDPQTNIISGGDAGSGCLIRITKAGDAHYEATQSALIPITITQASQTINFSSSPNSPTALGSYTVTASADSGDTVTFSIDPNYASVCSVVGNIVTFASSGTCWILADQAGNNNYSAAPQVEQHFTVARAPQTITATTPTNAVYGLGAQVALSVSASSNRVVTVTWVSGPCSAGGYTVFFSGAGHCELVLSEAGDIIYAPAPDLTLAFDIAKGVQNDLYVNAFSSTPYGQNVTLSSVGGSGTGAVSFAARGTCTVSGNVMTPGNAGTSCEVRAIQTGDADYDPIASEWFPITINKAEQAPMMITSSSLATYGQTLQVVATGGSGPSPWTYATTGACTIDSSGLLTPGDAGSVCTVTATKVESTNYLTKSTLAQTINIFKANQSITFTSSPSNPTALGSYTVTASADSGDAVTFAISPQSSSVCSISGSTVTFLTSGSCVIDADQAGNDNYNSATRVQQTITVAKAAQTITFTAAGVKKFGDSAFSAVASASSGLTITFDRGSGTTNTACSVASDGTVTILDVGICEVTADQSGDSVYAAAARATQQITINKGVQSTLTMTSSSSVTYGQTLTLSSTGGSGTGSVSYDVSGDCTESNGVLTVTIVGSACQVRAVKAADSQYLAKTSTWQTITVTKANQSTLTITSTNTVAYGGTITLTVSGGSGPTSLSYTTTGTCSVTSGVLHVGNANSSCTVTATNAASNNYEAVSSAAQTVTITKAANTVRFTSAAVNPTALGTYSLTASADSGDQVSFAINSSSSSVCSVSGSTVSFLTSGDCVIDASEDGNDNFNAASTVQQTVTVAKASQTITFTPTTSKRYGSGTFSVSASSNSNLAITYSRGSGTTNTACSVASDGTVTILDVGNCQITANQGGNIVYSAATAVNQDVTITKGIQATLTMTSASTDAYGDPLTLTAAGGSGTGTVTFAATGDCTISNGVLTVGVVGSTCSVTATKSGDSQYDPITSAAQTITTIKGTQAPLTINGNARQTYGTTQVLSTSGGSGNGAVTYSTGPGCSAMGNILTVGGGGSTCQVRAHKAASANYNTIDSVDFTVTVDKADQTITSHSTASLPAALDLYNPSGTASSGLTVTFDVDASTSSVCSKTVNAIRFDAGGTCKVNFFQAGNANYNAAPQVQETITVAKLDQSISGPGAFTVHYGDADFQIQATVTSGLAIAYTLHGTTTNNSCTISSTGMVHIVTTGICAWTMSQAGDAVYNSTSTGVYMLYIDRAQQASVSISVSSTTGFAFGTITVSGSGGSGTGSFSYATIGTCTVSGNTVTLGAYGSQCEVYAIKARDDNYADEASAATTITVTRASQATLLMSSGNTVAYGSTITLATSGGSGDGAVTYATTGTCSVNNGVLTVGNAGSACTVTATKAQSANYLAASSAAQTITITKANQTVAFTSSSTGWEALHTYTPTFSSSAGLSVDVTIDSATASVCTASNGVVTFLIAGTCTIHADQAGNSNYNPITQLTQSATVIKVGQIITVTPISRHYVGDASFNVTATSTSSNPFIYSLGSNTTNSACSVNSSTGLVMILATGTCEVNVDQNGDAAYFQAQTATVSFAIGKGAQAPLVITNLGTVTYGDVVNLLTSGGSVNGVAVTYSTTGTCSVNGAQLTFGDAGSLCTVTAFLDGNDQYLPVTSATVTATIQKADQAAFGLSNTAPPVYGQPYVLTTMGGSGDGAVTYEVTAPCTVSGDVVTVGDANINCYVTARKAASLNYKAVSDFQRVLYISRASQSISITSTPTSSAALDTYNVVATATSGQTVTVSIASASNTVCSVSGTTVTFLTAGSCVINVDQSGTTNYTAATRVQQTITVTKKAQTVTFPQVATQQFGAAAVSLTASAQSNLQVTYAVDSATTNNSCSVDNTNQTVTLLGAGECYLTADQAGNDTWSASAQATMHFTITRGDQATVSMTSGSSVVYGNTLSLTASGGSGTGSFTFAATGTCTVSGSTLTVGDAGSSCSVTATKAQDTNYLAKTSAAQTITITRATQATLVLSSIASVTYGQTLTLSTTGGSGTGAVTYTASGSCTVSGNTLTGGPAGSNCVVYATKAQSTNYNAIDSASRTQAVAKSAQTISLTSTPSSPTALGSYTVVATASSGLTPVITVDNASNTVCSVSGMVISFLTSGTCAIYADQSGDSNYNAATQVPQTITVAKAAQSITFNQPADVAMYATPPNFGATASSGLTVSYAVTSNGTAACSVTTGGALTAIAPGLCEISVSQSGNSVYATALAVVRSFNIIRATQATVTITSNSSVDYLGSITLNATGGSGTGAISFTANGTCSITNGVLSVGDVGSSCAVTATKAGDTNYNAQTSATQNITVNQIAQDGIIVVSAARVRYGQTLPLVSAGGSGSGAETWSIDTTNTSNTAGCAINSSTLTLSVTNAGACDVVVTKAASRNYLSAVSPRFTVTADKAYQSIAFGTAVPTQPLPGDTYTVAATSSSGLPVTFTIGGASVGLCSISGNVVTLIATGDCEIRADQAGDNRYLAAPRAIQHVWIGSLNQVITASTVINKTFGDPAFVIVGETTSTSPVTFARGANTTNSACSVTTTGVVRVLAVGHCEIVLSAAADATYAAASDITRNFDVVADQASAPFITSASADNQSVTLSFLPPSYTGGAAIRAYGINAYRNGVLAASYSGCASTDTSCTISGLTNGVAYTFRMFAVNPAGDGLESASAGPLTPATHAEAVRRLTAVGVNTALDVSWLAPASLGGGTFDSYRIYVRVRGAAYPSTPTEVIYDGTQTAKQITGLVNGTSYDVKVVTITTANTVQLVSNTAEVLQYPKTIPDAPQSVSLAPVSASNLLVSWTAPISDGGDAISAYTARVAGGSQCSVAGNTNACEVAGLVPGTVYTIDVFATNGAGDSTATVASITFRAASIAGANQNNPSSSSNSAGPANPTTGNRWETGGQVHEDLWIALDKIATAALNGSVDGVTISGKLGGKATFKGKGLDAVRSAYIGNRIPVKILKATDTELTVQLPSSKIDGWHDMWFFVDSHAIRYVDVVRYGVLQPNVTKWVKGYKAAPKQLTKAQKIQIKKYLKAVGKYQRVDCRGSYKAIHLTCKYIKTLRPAGYVHITKLKVKPNSKQAKVVKLTFTK